MTQVRALALCMPSRDGQLSVETHLAIGSSWPAGVPRLNIICSRKGVVDARNTLAADALAASRQFGIELLLWADSDAWWPPGTIERMLRTVEARHDLDMLTAYSGERYPFSAACSFIGSHAIQPRGTRIMGQRPPEACFFAPGDVVEIERTTMHFVLMRSALLEGIGQKPFSLPEGAQFGEDFTFCDRVRALGGKIGCDTGATVAHVDVDSGLAFIPSQRPGHIDGSLFVFVDDPRSDEEIFREWEPRIRMVRAKRGYGADVDAVLARMGHAVGGKDPLAGAKHIGRRVQGAA